MDAGTVFNLTFVKIAACGSTCALPRLEQFMLIRLTPFLHRERGHPRTPRGFMGTADLDAFDPDKYLCPAFDFTSSGDFPLGVSCSAAPSGVRPSA